MEVSQHAKECQRVLVIENQDNGAFVQAFQRALQVALGFDVCIHPVSEGESLHQILLALKGKSDSADVLYINAHLVYQECPDPSHCGGLELFKHIRLTPSLGRVSLLPVILAVLDSPERYIRLRTDNVIILSPGCAICRLPFSLQQLRGTINSLHPFDSYEEMQTSLRDFVILTTEERVASQHAYRNRVGLPKFLEEFCGDLMPADHPIRRGYEYMVLTSLWLKKMEFLQEGQSPTHPSTGEITPHDLIDCCRGKRFIYIDDEHQLGWSWGLYTGLFGNSLAPSIFERQDEMIETDGLLCISSFRKAREYFEEYQNQIENGLTAWVDAEEKYRLKNQEYNEAQSRLQQARNRFNESKHQREEIRVKLENDVKQLQEKETSFKEILKDFSEYFAVIWSDDLDPDAQDKELQQRIDTLYEAKKEFINAWRSQQNAQKRWQEAENRFQQAEEELEEAKEIFRKAQSEYNNAKNEYNRANRSLQEIFLTYSLIFLDLRLEQPSDEHCEIGEISGIRLLEQIKKSDPSIPVIVFTASEKALSYERAKALGADGYWIKGISSGSDLRREIKECIEKAEKLRPIWLQIRQLEVKKTVFCLQYENGQLSLRRINDGERQQILSWLKESFLLLYWKENVLDEYSVYDRVVLNMGLIQEVRYKGVWDENWQRLVENWQIPPKDQNLRRLRNQVVHAYQRDRDRGIVTMTQRRGVGVASPNEALEALRYTLEWLLNDLATGIGRR
jgi:CheY-like chemotaxis protein